MHHAALQLGFDVVGVDRIARVNANHHAVDLDVTLVADRHLAHARGVAAITLGFGNAAEHPFGQRTTPIGGLGHGLQDGHIARRLLAQIGQAKRQWVFARGQCHLVDEALAHVRVLRMAHGAPKAHRHIGVALRVIDQTVGDVVGVVVEAGHGLAVHTLGQGQAQQGGQNRWRADADVQGLHLAIVVHATFEAHQAGGAVQIVLHVLLTAPHHLDRRAGHGLGNHHALAGEVLRALAPQTTAQLHGVHGDFVLGHACGGRRHRQGVLRVLGGRPHIQLVALQPGGAHHGLHGRVCQIGGEVLGFQHFGRRAQGLHGVAIVARHRQLSLAHAGLEAVHDDRAGELAVVTGLPINGHFAQRLFGTPPIVGHHSHKFAHVEHFDNATAVFHLGRVQGLDLAVEHRAGSDGGIHHARHLGIDAVTDLAGDDIGDVHTRQRFANDFPVLGVFELDIFGRFKLGSSSGQFAVRQAALAGGVAHFAQSSSALTGRHAPLGSGGGNEHLARSGTRFAQILLRVADGAAAHGGHVAIRSLGAQVFVCGGIFDAHFFPVGFQLVGHQHGGRGAAALAHFGAGIANDHRIVGLYFNPGIELGGFSRVAVGGPEKTQRHARSRGGRDFEEIAPGQAGGGWVEVCHARTPFLATAWMAVRMRA